MNDQASILFKKFMHFALLNKKAKVWKSREMYFSSVQTSHLFQSIICSFLGLNGLTFKNKKQRHFTYYVTLRSVRKAIVAVEKL